MGKKQAAEEEMYFKYVYHFLQQNYQFDINCSKHKNWSTFALYSCDSFLPVLYCSSHFLLFLLCLPVCCFFFINKA